MKVREVEANTAPAFPAPYKALRCVGRGGFGEVWQVHDLDSDRLCAAKILLSPEPALRAAFYHEYAMLYRLRHPGLVRTYDWSQLETGTPFFTMSWAEGPVLVGARLGPTEKLRALWELLDSLTFIHSQGLVHADLKPENVRYDEALLREPFSPEGPRALCLLDFGLTLDRKQEGREGRGTVPYMAPEWFGTGSVNHRADLYSLGILIHSLWTGRPPFLADDPLVIVQKHLEAEPPRLAESAPDVPELLEEATQRLLAKQPEVRDKGKDLLSRFLADRLGSSPGTGKATVEFHRASLGRHARQLPPQLVDLWLGPGQRRTVLCIRGGLGLEQEQTLDALVPELARYKLKALHLSGPGELSGIDATLRAGLVEVTDATAPAWLEYVERWLTGETGPARLALALNADSAAQRPLVLSLAQKAHSGLAHVVSAGCLDEGTLHRLAQVAAPGLDAATHNRLAREACGNPSWLFALAHDALSGGTRFQALAGAQQALVEESLSAQEKLAMCLLASARTEVERSVLRALADVPWPQYLSRWLDLGYVTSRAGRMRWLRADLAQTLSAGQSQERARILHRAWAEYWGSFAPDPGSDEHEHLVSHALESNAPRRAVRVGLEAARHWLEKHQAQRALLILDKTHASLAAIESPPPAWVFEHALLTSETKRVLARYAEARDDLKRALTHPAVRGKLRWEAEIYKRTGDLCRSLKDPEAGRLALEAALERFRGLSDKAEISHVLNNLGNVQFVAGDLAGALSRYTEALELQRELARPRDIASTLNNIGGLLVLRSEYERAVSRLTESVTLQRTLNDPEALARSLNNLSVAYVETGRYAEADTVLSESYKLNVSAGKTGEQLFNLENLAAVSLARGEWPAAMSHCEAGLKLCQDADARGSRLPFTLVTARVALAQGNYEATSAALREVERLSEGLTNPDTELAIQSARTDWDLCRGFFDSGLETGRAAAELAEREGLPSWVARASLQLASAHLAQGDFGAARHDLHRALATSEKIGALPEQIRSRTLLAEVEASGGAVEQASDHLRRVEKLMLECSARPLFLPFSAALTTYYRRRGELEMALSACDTARKLASYLAMPDWTWRFLADAGHVLVALNRFDQASSYYKGAVEILALLAEKLDPKDRDSYFGERAKASIEEGLGTCHAALVA